MTQRAEELTKRILAKDLKAVARAISLCENGAHDAQELRSKLFPHTGRAHIIGVTGSPGAGKSTLVDALANEMQKAGRSVAIIAIDPTSPFSGGAILGDRIRMTKAAETAGVFIRSMASRGRLGGLSAATRDALTAIDVAGFDFIFIETVGVGQAEVDIVTAADSCLVVLVPGMGDSVQIIKAGILEIADIFVVNKSDRDGADLVHKDLRVLLSLAEYAKNDWRPPIVKCVATRGSGVDELIKSIDAHKDWLGSEKGLERRQKIFEKSILSLAEEKVRARFPRAKLPELAAACSARTLDPHSAASRLIDEAMKS